MREAQLYRSTTCPEDTSADTLAPPVTLFPLPIENGRAKFTDSLVAHNVTYYYWVRLVLEDGAEVLIGTDSVTVPNREVGKLWLSSIFIDKQHYFLELRDDGIPRKRYPIALGKNPVRRKLHKDFATTPEGIYRVEGTHWQTRLRKVFDLNYPNEVDEARYSLSKTLGLLPLTANRAPGIGNEIQIHRGGIERNWTSGCISLRDKDMDELLEQGRVKIGTAVTIVGSELDRGDIVSIQAYRSPQDIKDIQRRLRELGYYDQRLNGVVGRATRLALGRFQQDNNLPITCDFDRRTIELLSKSATIGTSGNDTERTRQSGANQDTTNVD